MDYMGNSQSPVILAKRVGSVEICMREVLCPRRAAQSFLGIASAKLIDDRFQWYSPFALKVDVLQAI